MTSYATETTPVQPAAALTFTEVLPAAPGVRPAALRWTPGRMVGTGLLCIQTPAGRCNCEYLAVELPGGDGRGGRAALFAKTTPGSDAEADSYTATVSRDGRGGCECRGFLRHGHCKHEAALRALLANGWMDLHLSNPDADTGCTEPIEDQPEPVRPARPSWMDRAEAAV
ncbi:hypothetical protein [Urbifossiella limnaea]|uniref:SWIM-type domain-containing protein n=1 Tax=Urbifossiella limnaea TaxID=2528023 RepID=A0A517Y2U1_9BACT|nr:hypothetical protein [Urbifossiella limnaea]QDU24039.1 hypothetical protein ETAA1_60500 [Urbifossiella limnaea]